MFMSSYSLPWPRAPHCSRASRVHHPPSLPGRGRDDSACRICLFVCLPCCLAALTAAVSAPNDLSPSPSCRCYHVCSGTMSSSLLSFSAPPSTHFGSRHHTCALLFSLGRWPDRDTDRQRDRQTDRQTGRPLTSSFAANLLFSLYLCSCHPPVLCPAGGGGD